MLRSDRGTENTLVAELQIALRTGHGDELAGVKSMRFGSSPANLVCMYFHVYQDCPLLFIVTV